MLKNTAAFVFHGFKPRDELFKRRDPSGNSVNMESDFVIVLPGIVVALECKTTLDSEQFKKAGRQWAELKLVLEEELGLSQDWRFIQCLAYENVGHAYQESERCDTCGPFLLKYEKNESFLEKLQALLPKEQNACTDEAYTKFKSVVQDLLILSSESKDCSDAEDRVANAFARRHTQFMNTPAETIFFWSPDQYDLLKKDQKLLLLKGGNNAMF